MSAKRHVSRFRVLAFAGLLVIGAGVTAIVRVDGLRWRAGVITLKLSGDLHDVGWRDLAVMMGPKSGYWLKPLVETPNPYVVITDPYTTSADVEGGRVLFQSQCAGCHGSSGQGAAGPALVGHELVHGSSDWALYRNVRDGIQGTPMPAHSYSRLSLWRLVAYIRTLTMDHQHSDVSAVATAAERKLSAPFDSMRGAAAAGDNWPTYYGSHNGYRYSALADIDRANVGTLQVRWLFQLPKYQGRAETTPITAGDRVFLTEPSGGVIALDARSGQLLWRFQHEVPKDIRLCCVVANRGVAILDDRVFVATLDAHLVALDGTTGHVIWDQVIADYRAGYSSTGAPLAVKGMIVTGIAGSEYGVPGFVTAVDARSGDVLWRFDTVPKPGNPANASWGGDSWQKGGAATWMTGTYDPVPDLIYWGVANAAPDYDASLRPGDNLYTNSVIALHADTGKLSWYFQYSPGDDHDWDAVQVPVLANLADGPNSQRVLLSANRNGFFYALERTTGTFLRATPFVKQTWAEKITAAGRPIRRLEATPSLQGVLIYPGSEGGTNWWPPTFDPVAQQLIVPVLEQPGLFFKSADSELSEKNALLGGSSSSVSHDRYSAIRALDPRTGELKWEHRSLDLHDRGHLCGLTSTAGRLVFGCDQSRIIALDVEDGRLLWSFDTGSNIFAPAVTYRVDNDQMVTIVAGSVVLTFALPQSVAAQPPAQRKASR